MRRLRAPHHPALKIMWGDASTEKFCGQFSVSSYGMDKSPLTRDRKLGKNGPRRTRNFFVANWGMNVKLLKACAFVASVNSSVVSTAIFKSVRTVLLEGFNAYLTTKKLDCAVANHSGMFPMMKFCLILTCQKDAIPQCRALRSSRQKRISFHQLEKTSIPIFFNLVKLQMVLHWSLPTFLKVPLFAWAAWFCKIFLQPSLSCQYKYCTVQISNHILLLSIPKPAGNC